MWFLSLGILLLMTWCLQRVAAATAELFAPIRRQAFQRTGGSTAAQVGATLLLTLLDPSPAAVRVQASTAQALRLRSWRLNLMAVCFAELSQAVLIAVGLFFLGIGGLFPLSAGVFLMAFARFRPRELRPAGALLFFFGLFLWAGETGLRFAPGTVGMEAQGLAMWLADGRPAAVSLWFLAATALAALTGFEFLALSATMMGLASGALSLNGAVALLWGERLGLVLRWWWQSRGQIASVRAMTKGVLAGHLLAVLFSFLLLGFARDFMGAAAYGREGLGTILMDFLALSLWTVVPFLAFVCLWGHFAGRRSPEDMLQNGQVPEAWFTSQDLRSSMIPWFLEGLCARRAELKRLNGGFTDEEWKKVPPPVRQASEKESLHLEKTSRALEAHLLSRSDFFGHQMD